MMALIQASNNESINRLIFRSVNMGVLLLRPTLAERECVHHGCYAGLSYHKAARLFTQVQSCSGLEALSPKPVFGLSSTPTVSTESGADHPRPGRGRTCEDDEFVTNHLVGIAYSPVLCC